MTKLEFRISFFSPILHYNLVHQKSFQHFVKRLFEVVSRDKECSVAFKTGFALHFTVPCPAGEFSRSGLMPCHPCPSDYYQPDPGKSYCLSCPFYGTTTVIGANSIADCSSKLKRFSKGYGEK